MSIVTIIDPLYDRRWDDFVMSHPESTIFHTSAWAKVIYKTYHYLPCYHILCDRAGQIKAGFPFFLIKSIFTGNRMVCLPFTDYCPPLFDGNHINSEIVAALIDSTRKNGASYMEIRGGMGTDENMLQSLTKFSYYRLFRLNLNAGLETIWKNFKQKSIRYPIKKAQSLGLNIENCSSEKDMHNFYALNVRTRKKHGVIPQPYVFFRNIHSELIVQGKAFLSLAKLRGRIIAGSIFFVYKNTIYHKFNASDLKYLSCQPNHLILWEAIKHACSMGYSTFDLGRTSPDNIGLMSFKRHWGAQEYDLPYYCYPKTEGISTMRESNRKYQFASFFLKRMPTWILRILGKNLYHYLA